MNETTTTPPAAAMTDIPRPETLGESFAAVFKKEVWGPLFIAIGMILTFAGSFWWAAAILLVGFCLLKERTGTWFFVILGAAFVIAHVGGLMRVGYFSGASGASAAASSSTQRSKFVEIAGQTCARPIAPAQKGSFPLGGDWVGFAVPKGYDYTLTGNHGGMSWYTRLNHDRSDKPTEVSGADVSTGQDTWFVEVCAKPGSAVGNIEWEVHPASLDFQR